MCRNFIAFRAVLLVRLLVAVCAYLLSRLFFALRLGAVECLDNVSDPLQQISELQQGKQFDHIHLIPLLLKSNILFNLYVCMLLCQMNNLSYRGS